MFPTEIEIQQRHQDYQREAENERLVQSLRTQPTLWKRFLARLSTPSIPLEYQQHAPSGVRRDVIASSR